MLEERMDRAQQLVRQAGALLREVYTGEKHVKNKGRIDLITEFDLESECILVDGLRASFPSDAIISEESHHVSDHDDYWLIDPIDGTTNFTHGLPDFTICMAYVRNDEPVLGVIYIPVRDELYSALDGGGAFMNGQSIHVSQENSLERSLLAAGYPYALDQTDFNVFEAWQRLFYQSRGIRHLGCASLNPSYIAAGKLEAYWESGFQPWDLAAGIVIVREAGGRVTRLDGSDYPLARPCTILATNGRIHDNMLDLLNLASTRLGGDGGA